MSENGTRLDKFSFGGEHRQVELVYPPDLGVDEADEVIRWLGLVATKIRREAVARQMLRVRDELELLAASIPALEKEVKALRRQAEELKDGTKRENAT